MQLINEVMTMKILNKNIDGLPEIGRKIAIYAAKHHEFMTVKRCDKVKILAKNWDNPEQHISSDGEFYSGDNGWIYPVDFDQYIYLDELISDRTKMREIDEAKMEEMQIKEVLDDFFITNRIPTGDELLFKQALYSVLIKEKRVGDSPEKFHELIFPFSTTKVNGTLVLDINTCCIEYDVWKTIFNSFSISKYLQIFIDSVCYNEWKNSYTSRRMAEKFASRLTTIFEIYKEEIIVVGADWKNN